MDLIHEREILEEKIVDLERTTREWAQKFVDATDKQKLIQINHEHLLNNIKRQYRCKSQFFANENSLSIFFPFQDSILAHCIKQMSDGIDRKDDGIEYLLSRLEVTTSTARKIQDLWKAQNDSDECQCMISPFFLFILPFSCAPFVLERMYYIIELHH